MFGFRQGLRWLGGIVAVSLLLVACGANPADKTVAEIGTTPISEGQLNQAVAATQVLQGVHLDSTPLAVKSQVRALVQQQVVITWALRHHVTSAKMARRQASGLIAHTLAPSVGGQGVLAERLRSNQLAESAFRQYVINQVMVQDAFNRVTQSVSAPSITVQRRYYLNNEAFYVSPPEVLLRDIMVHNKSQAEAIESQIQHGASFSALATRDSLDQYKSQGGSRGWVQLGASSALPHAWRETVTSLKPGHMSIVHGPLGYSIIEVQASRAGAVIPFSVVQPAIQAELVQSAKEKAFDTWAANLMKSQTVRLYNVS